MPSDKPAVLQMIKQALLVAFGVWLIITALQFAGLNETTTSSTKVENATIGAAVGAGVGFGTYLIIGAVGVATGGVGFALGAIALTAIGTGAGALTGAATGKTTLVLYSYPTWLWVAMIVFGCVALYAAYLSLRAATALSRKDVLEVAERSPQPATRLAWTARVAAILLVGVVAAAYVSTLTTRRPPPPPDFENVVFIKDSLPHRLIQRVQWSGREKRIMSRWDGYYLLAGKMTFREVDGKWHEQQAVPE